MLFGSERRPGALQGQGRGLLSIQQGWGLWGGVLLSDEACSLGLVRGQCIGQGRTLVEEMLVVNDRTRLLVDDRCAVCSYAIELLLEISQRMMAFTLRKFSPCILALRNESITLLRQGNNGCSTPI